MKEEASIGCMQCQARLNSIFKDLSAEEITNLDNMKTCQFYKKGEIVFNQGSYPRGIFCVHAGKIKVTQVGTDGKEQIVHLIHDSDVMGHRAIFGDDTFSCSAIAMEDSQVCFIPKSPFYTMVESNPKLSMKISHLLAEELKEAERKITHIAQHPVKDRLAQALLVLKNNYGFEQDGKTINVLAKREDLANLVGTSRETVTRALYELQAQNIIELKGKKVIIRDEIKLNQLAGLFT